MPPVAATVAGVNPEIAPIKRQAMIGTAPRPPVEFPTNWLAMFTYLLKLAIIISTTNVEPSQLGTAFPQLNNFAVSPVLLNIIITHITVGTH
jgi:hypothetical protein